MTASGVVNPSPSDATEGRSLAVYTSIDQVLSSSSNALLVFALARVSSVEQFGAVVLLVAGVSAVIGFNRGALGTPMLLTSNLERRWIIAESEYAVSWALAGGIALIPVFAVVGGLSGHLNVGLAFAVSIPFALAQDALRFASIALGTPKIAVTSDALWAGWMVIVFASTMLGDLRPSPEITICLWGLGAAVSSLVIAVPLRTVPRWARITEWWSTYARSRVRFGGVYTLNQVGAFLVTVVVTLMIGSAAAAGVRGAAAVFGPIAMLVSALPLVFIPHARRQAGSLRSQWRVLKMASTITSAITLVIAVCLAFTPPQVGSAVLGATWAEAGPVIPLIGIECVAMCWIVSVYSFFQAQGDSKLVLRLNIMQCGTQIILCSLAAYAVGTVMSIGVALAVSGVLSTVIGIALVSLRIRAAGDADASETGAATAEADVK